MITRKESAVVRGVGWGGVPGQPQSSQKGQRARLRRQTREQRASKGTARPQPQSPRTKPASAHLLLLSTQASVAGPAGLGALGLGPSLALVPLPLVPRGCCGAFSAESPVQGQE